MAQRAQDPPEDFRTDNDKSENWKAQMKAQALISMWEIAEAQYDEELKYVMESGPEVTEEEIAERNHQKIDESALENITVFLRNSLHELIVDSISPKTRAAQTMIEALRILKSGNDLTNDDTPTAEAERKAENALRQCLESLEPWASAIERPNSLTGMKVADAMKVLRSAADKVVGEAPAAQE